jgi:hypothetical protein
LILYAQLYAALIETFLEFGEADVDDVAEGFV